VPKKSSKLPKEVIQHWPEVFEDIEIDVVPLEYLDSVRISFVDGKIWDIAVKDKDNIETLEKSLDELFEEYQDAIQNVDFRLNTDKVKRDITKRTKKFLKLRK
jgi:vacuolar-type H+-ATPase subunit I/STV1